MSEAVASPRVLLNFVEAHQLGHAVEALRYAAGHRAAVPDAHLALALNSATPLELAGMCELVDEVHGVPLYGTPAERGRALAAIPRDWDYVLDNFRREQPAHADVVPGFATYYAESDWHFRAALGRALIARPVGPTPGYVRDQHLRLEPDATARARARQLLEGRAPRVALLPAGSSARSLYPSARSWQRVLEALRARLPTAAFVLVGKLRQDERSSSSFSRTELDALLAAQPGAVDAFDLPLAVQLALVEACDVFVSTHSGFGLAALAVETPWLCISGGGWPEYFFNHVPFHSVLPDPERFGRYSLYQPAPLEPDDEGDGPRALHATAARIRADLDQIVDAAESLVDRRVSYDEAMRDHFARVYRYLGEDSEALFALDAVHLAYRPPSA